MNQKQYNKYSGLPQTWYNIPIAEYSNCVVATAEACHSVCTVQQMWLIAIAPKVVEITTHTPSKVFVSISNSANTYRNIVALCCHGMQGLWLSAVSQGSYYT